MQRRN